MIYFLLISIFILILFGIPVAFALGISSLFTIIIDGNIPLMLIPQRLFTGTDSFILLCIPFFILAGEIMNSGGIAKRLFNFCNTALGHIRGGLAHVNILISMIFAGMTGAAAADSSAIGSIIIPAMIEEKYDVDFTCAVTAVSSTIGVIIPPSIPMVLYGTITGVSVTKLFIAGFIPGILVGIAQMIVTHIISLKRGYPKRNFPGIKILIQTFYSALLALGMPVVLIGGILSGIFTPTEAGAIAVIYGFIISVFLYKILKFSELIKLLAKAIQDSAAVMLIVASASLFSWLITYTGIPKMVGDFLLSLTLSPTNILLIIVLIYLFAGCIIDMGANVVMLTPIFYPIVVKLGIDPIHFGLITVVTLAIGLVTPPVGICTFIVSNIAKIPINRTLKASIPYLICMIIVVILIIFIPSLTTFLPAVLSK